MSALTHLCMHFHCDPIFTCPQATHIEESVELAAQYVSMCREDPEFRCILSETDYLQGYWNLYAEDREFLLRLMAEGRVETSGSYSEPNENSVGGEALVRNIVYGQWFQVGYLGGRGDIYMPHDVFGHVRQLPQILRKAGFLASTWTKGSPKPGAPDPCFQWLAPDGSSILTRVTSYGGVDWGGSDQIGGVLHMGDGHGKSLHGPTLLFRGRDFVSPPGWAVGNTDKLREHGVVMSQPSAYFAEVQSAIVRKEFVPELSGRELSQYHVGTALSRIELKIATRIAEETLVEAETWATIATLQGHQYPEPIIDHAWRQLLFCQHHDSITGTSNDQSYLDLLSHLREALSESRSARDNAVEKLASHVATDGDSGEPIVVFNSLGHTRSDIVEVPLPGTNENADYCVVGTDGMGKPVEVIRRGGSLAGRFLADSVPGMGYSTFRVSEQPGPGGHSASAIESDDAPVVVETPFARVTLDPMRGGGIVSLVERKSGREIASGTSPYPLNDLVLLKEGPGVEPSWEFSTTGERIFSSSIRASVKAERTPLGWQVTIRQPFPECEELVRRLEFFNHTPRIECTIVLSGYSGSRLVGEDTNTRPWGGSNEGKQEETVDRDLFGVLFPVGPKGLSPVWSDRFGQRVIHRSRSFLDFRTHQSRIYSGCGMYSAEKWIAASPCVAFVSEDNGASPRGIPLGMVRIVYPENPATREAAELLIAALAREGVTATPYLDTENQNGDGLQTDQIIVIGGTEANRFAAAHPEWDLVAQRSLVSITLTNEDPRRIPVLAIRGDAAAAAAETRRMAEELRRWRISVHVEQEVEDLLEPLDDAGLAVLNRGTIAASAEPGGGIFLALQHAAGWCDWATPNYLGFQFVPERKSTVHRYAFVPFAGNWSDAALPAHAQEYNRPLTPVATGIHPGELPPVGQFIDLRAGSALVSALKPAGQPSAEFVRREMNAADGMVLRLWNWRGTPDACQVRLGSGLASAHGVDLAERNRIPLEINEGSLETTIGPNSIETLLLTPARAARRTISQDEAPIAPRRIESRWWRHNLGAAPLGNMPVAVGLRGDVIPGETGDIVLSVVNNLLGHDLVGTVRLYGPKGWEISPAEFPVTLEERAGTTTNIRLAVPEGMPGRLVCELGHEGSTYTDSLTIGELTAPEVTVEHRGNTVNIEIRNPSQDLLPVSALLITPLDTWNEWAHPNLEPIPEFRTEFVIAPGDSRQVAIEIPERALSRSWAFVKVAALESCQYIAVPVRRPTEAVLTAGAPFCLSAPLSDVALRGVATVDGSLSCSATSSARPPRGVKPSGSPMPAYWTLSPVPGIEGVSDPRLRFAINPKQSRKSRDSSGLGIAIWRNGVWESLATEFDEKRWELTVEVPLGALADQTHWALITPHREAWRASVGRRFFEAHPEVADINDDGDAEVILGTAGNGVCALTSRGDVLWRRRFGGWMWQSPEVTVADVDGEGRQEIVVAPSDRSLALLDGAGHVCWVCNDLPFAIKQKPLVADINGDGRNEIVVSVNDNGVFAFANDGTRLWHHELEPVRLSSPVILHAGDGGASLLVNVGGRVLARLGGDGSLQSEVRFSEGWARDAYVPDPVVTDRLRPGLLSVLFAGHDGILRLLGPDGGQYWECDLGSPITRAPVVVPEEDGEPAIIVCGAARQTLCGISADGVILWRTAPKAHVQSPLSCVDVDGDGHMELVLGCGRDQRTSVYNRHGAEKAYIPYSAIWTNGAVRLPAGSGAAAALVTGDTEGFIVAAIPYDAG